MALETGNHIADKIQLQPIEAAAIAPIHAQVANLLTSKDDRVVPTKSMNSAVDNLPNVTLHAHDDLMASAKTVTESRDKPAVKANKSDSTGRTWAHPTGVTPSRAEMVKEYGKVGAELMYGAATPKEQASIDKSWNSLMNPSLPHKTQRKSHS